MLVSDSQNRSGDPYTALALASQATSRLQLGTGVTNPFTRHPAVTAAAISAVQDMSNGRAVLGIGRGDSALASLGLKPVRLDDFALYVKQLQAYLKGERVHQAGGEAGKERPGAWWSSGSDTPGNALEWLDPRLPKVPVDVAASGPRAIALGAVLGERVSLSVGANPRRLEEAVGLARCARETAGLDPAALSIGAYVNVVVHSDRDTAMSLAMQGLKAFARFSAYQLGSKPDSRPGVVTPELALSVGVLGPAEKCAERLLQIARLGVDRLVIVGASGPDRVAVADANRCFVEEVIPMVRG
jgi:5,10-methylenetetrahydromethanopterin reductase